MSRYPVEADAPRKAPGNPEPIAGLENVGRKSPLAGSFRTGSVVISELGTCALTVRPERLLADLKKSFQPWKPISSAVPATISKLYSPAASPLLTQVLLIAR